MGVSETQVLVIGGGPTGLTLAIALGQQGVRVRLVERKHEAAFLPKMERTNARSMEIYRRMGLAEDIRAASKFTPLPMSILLVTALNEPPMLHLRYPSVAEAKAQQVNAYARENQHPLLCEIEALDDGDDGE